MKKCGRCKEYLEENLFSFHKGKLQSFCKPCQSEYAREYRKKNPRVLIDNLRKWRKHNTSEREVTEEEKLRNEFRAKVRRLIKLDDNTVDSIFGYSANQLKHYLIDNFGRLPKGNFCLSYIVPLKEFDLTNVEVWKEAGALTNLEIVEKNT